MFRVYSTVTTALGLHAQRPRRISPELPGGFLGRKLPVEDHALHILQDAQHLRMARRLGRIDGAAVPGDQVEVIEHLHLRVGEQRFQLRPDASRVIAGDKLTRERRK